MKHLFKSKILPVALGALTATSFMAAKPAAAQTYWLGQIVLGGWNFCPRTTLPANGQLLPIAQWNALFSLLGTNYGGDGRTTFGLPDLRGRAAIQNGTGPGLSTYNLGARAGSETTTMTNPNQLPAHSHTVKATDAVADKKGPGNDFLAKGATTADAIYHNGPPNKDMDPGMIANTGSSAPIPVRNPILSLQYCVVTQGTFPSRN